MAGEMEKRMILYFEAQGIQNIPKAVKRAKKETDYLSLSVSELNDKYGDIDKKLSLLAKGYAKTERKATSSLNKITAGVRKLDSATASSTARIGAAASALKGLALPSSFGSAIKIIMDYEKVLVSLSAITKSYSIGISSLEKNTLSLRKSLNLTRMDLLALQESFYSGFMNIQDPSKDFEAVMTRIRAVTGSNSQKMNEYAELWKKLSKDFPGISKQLMNLQKGEEEAFKAMMKRRQGPDLHKKEIKMINALADAYTKVGGADKKRQDDAKDNIDIMKKFEIQVEDVAHAFRPLLSILKEVGDILSSVQKRFQDMGISAEALAKMSIGVIAALGAVNMAAPIVGGMISGSMAAGGTALAGTAVAGKALALSASKIVITAAAVYLAYKAGNRTEKGMYKNVGGYRDVIDSAAVGVARGDKDFQESKRNVALADFRFNMQQRIKGLRETNPEEAKRLQGVYDAKYKTGPAFAQLAKDREVRKSTEFIKQEDERKRNQDQKNKREAEEKKIRKGVFGDRMKSGIIDVDSLELGKTHLANMDKAASQLERNLKSTVERMRDIGGVDLAEAWDKAQQVVDIHRKKIQQLKSLQSKTMELMAISGSKTLEELEREGVLTAENLAHYEELGFNSKQILSDVGDQADFGSAIEESTKKQYEALQMTAEALQGIITLEKARASLMSSTVSLMDNYAIGVGASAKVRMMEFEAHGKVVEKLKQERKLQEKIIAGSSSGSEAATKAQTKLLEIEQEILSVQQQRAASVRALRDGWIGAISAMNTGAGRFSKIMFDQQKNTGAMLGMLGQSAVISSKTGKMGRGAGYKTSEQFSAYGGIKRGKKGFAYKTWLDGVMESRYPGYGSRILGGIEKGHREEMMMETSRMMQTSGDIAGSKGGTTLGLMGHQYLKGPYLEGNTGANNITVNNNIEVRSEVSPERLQRIVNQGTSEALGLYTGRRDN